MFVALAWMRTRNCKAA